MVHEAYAIYALLSVLMNCNDDTVDLGSELINLKEFTDDFPPMVMLGWMGEREMMTGEKGMCVCV